MTDPAIAAPSWRDRALEQAQAVDRARSRGLRTAESIVTAARTLVVERRGAPFTTQELVERCGHSLQTVYRYFPSKDELLLAVFEEAIAVGNGLIAEAAGAIADPAERLRLIVAQSIPDETPAAIDLDAAVLISMHTQLMLVFPDEVEHTQVPYIALVRRCIDDMVDAGLIAPRAAPDQDARLITYLVRSTYQTLVTSWDQRRSRVAAHVAEFCLAALGRPP